MIRAFVVVAALLAACGDAGVTHQLLVHPSERARANADALQVSLVRSTDGARTIERFVFPSPIPTPPWRLDVHTRGWGADPVTVEVRALAAGSTIAAGAAALVGTTTDVDLVDGIFPDDGGIPTDASTGVAPRLVAPLSGSRVSRAQPLLRIDRGGSMEELVLELCADRACAVVLEPIVVDAQATTALPAGSLPPSLYFWRVRDPLRGVESATWSFRVIPGASSAHADTQLGVILDVDGDGHPEVAIGAPATRIAADAGAGRVYVYAGSATGVSATNVSAIDGPDGAGTAFGKILVAAGDLNGDGFGDVAVGMPASDGHVYVYLGGPSGLSANSRWTLPGSDGAQASFGATIAAAGDVDGDGYAELLVGAPAYAVGSNAGVGRAHLFFGGATGLRASSVTLDSLDGAGASYGTGLAGAGDVNDDGYADIAVMAPGVNVGEGKVHVYTGSPTGPDPSSKTASFAIALTGSGRDENGALAFGDVDGDGRSELIVGSAATASSLGADAGRVRVVPFGVVGPIPSEAVVIDGPSRAGERFGTAVTLGDFNADGYDDLAVYDPAGGGALQEVVHIYYGSDAGLTPGNGPTTSAVTTAAPSGTGFGSAISGRADLDGDLADDLVIGAPAAAMGAGETTIRSGATGLKVVWTLLSAPGALAFGTRCARRPVHHRR